MSSTAPSAAGDAAAASSVHLTSGFWFDEEITPEMGIRMRLKRVLFDKQSDFQYAQVIETGQFGKTLVLDGKSQSALADEFVYHESLVHPALLTHPNPRTVYIGGGGELATAREIAKHPSVEKIVMVDIDKTVVEVCKTELPEWHDGVIEDPRLEIHYDDAKAWLERCEDKFDVVIMDIADPIEAGPGIMLYTEEFYRFIHSRMNEGGIFVTQSGPGSVMNATECFSTIYQTLLRSFDCVVPYTSDIPSFGSNWAFNMAFNKDAAICAEATKAGQTNMHRYLLGRDLDEVDKEIATRINKPLRFMDAMTLRGILGVPKPVRDQLEAETRHMTKDNPVYMY